MRSRKFFTRIACYAHQGGALKRRQRTAALHDAVATASGPIGFPPGNGVRQSSSPLAL